MGKPSFFDNVREWIGGLGFRLFLWAYRMTQDEYIEMILDDARREYASEKANSWLMR